MARHVVAAVADIPLGSRKVVTVKGREIAIFNVKGTYYAFLNKCPHMGAKLCFGAVVGYVEAKEPGDYQYSRNGEILRCPWHGWEFDMRTGYSIVDPEGIRVRQYPAEVERGDGLAEGTLKAETFPVHVEQDYVVLEA
jgi:3-phenylpropionate/trans-cinnamate dioxygenase ferredoxin subunit